MCFSPAVAKIIFRLSRKLFKTLRQCGYNVNSNMCVGPLGLCSILTMAWGGTMSSTNNDLQDFLKLTKLENSYDIHDELQLVRVRVYALANVHLSYLMRINTVGTVRASFERLLADFYRNMWLDNRDVDEFENECYRLEINRQVAEQTHFIMEFVPAGILKEEIGISLLSSVYMKASILAQNHVMEHQAFYIDHENRVDVVAMVFEGRFRIGKSSKMRCEILELPLSEDDVSMFIFLPSAVDGLKVVEKKLKIRRLRESTSKMEQNIVKVILPKFQLDRQFCLEEILPAMGLQSLLVPDADFSGITESNDLFISTIFHRTVFQMDIEEPMSESDDDEECSPIQEPCGPMQLFQVDRPFLFFVKEMLSDCIILWGRVADPRIVM